MFTPLNVKRSDGEDGAATPLPEDEFEFVVQGNEESVDQQKILEDLKAKEAELTQARAQADSVAALRGSFGEFAETLKKQTTPNFAPPQLQQQPFDIEKYKAEFNSKLFEDPFGTVTSLMQQQQMYQVQANANQNVMYSKQLVKIDPETKEYMSRWEQEVEEVVQAMPAQVKASNPHVYKEALNQVKIRHFDELLKEQVAEALKAQGVQAQVAAPRPMQYSETASVAPSSIPSGGKKQVRISPQLNAQIEYEAMQKGIPVDKMREIYMDRGLIR